jgi:hypothetical protein
MIRYTGTLAEIEAEIDTASPTWRERAAERTQLFRELGYYTESVAGEDGRERKLPPFWSEVKPVFMRLQYRKCIYCETRLEGGSWGPIQWDLEHFRPKGRIRRWPSADSELHYRFATGDESEHGYYLLSYHPGNYAAACKTCNTLLKSDYFPIAGPRRVEGDHPAQYAEEKPFLVYPIGTDDEDPQDLIAFEGVTAVPRHKRGVKNRRARVMIDFFSLNRDQLMEMRAEHLAITVWPVCKLARQGDEDGSAALSFLLSERARYANCARCFVDLCQTNISKAARHVVICKEILKTTNP